MKEQCKEQFLKIIENLNTKDKLSYIEDRIWWINMIDRWTTKEYEMMDALMEIKSEIEKDI